MKVYIHKKPLNKKKYKYNIVTIVVFCQRNDYHIYTQLNHGLKKQVVRMLSLDLIVNLIGTQGSKSCAF